MADNLPTIHASAVLVGAKAVLIRGPSGSGKSRLAWDLLQAGVQGALPFARLVADDRTLVEAHGGRLLVRPAPALAGLLEVHGLGIRRLPFEPVAVVGLVVDLSAEEGRMPGIQAGKTTVSGVDMSRLSVASGSDALPLVLACLSTTQAND
jgi:serine kinase of HPr protein (carbohydrate metabolism regulator)